jgi:hypothetical protein
VNPQTDPKPREIPSAITFLLGDKD